MAFGRGNRSERESYLGEQGGRRKPPKRKAIASTPLARAVSMAPVGGNALKEFGMNAVKDNPSYEGNTDVHGAKPNVDLSQSPRRTTKQQKKKRKPQTGSSDY